MEESISKKYYVSLGVGTLKLDIRTLTLTKQESELTSQTVV